MVDTGLEELLKGYQYFLDNNYAQEAERYQTLAAIGQSPRTMVIACSDSRVDPSRIFNAGPGELFVVRNVANLVPPCEACGSYHGTSSAIEFAVTMLHVERIIVLGHARCGGVRAFLDVAETSADPKSFIDKWISLLHPPYQTSRPYALHLNATQRQAWMEEEGIRHSVANLRTFPFVSEAIVTGQLQLRGAHFDISSGKLRVLDQHVGSKFDASATTNVASF